MSPDLEALIAQARQHVMTPEEERAQRRSFVYGNTRIENARITRELVDEVDREL